MNTNHISRIGLGCVTFGREIDRAAAFAFMDHARAKGINFFDTAAAYGKGASEEIVGAWMALRKPGNILVATKILPPFEPDAIVRSVNECLTRLGVHCIDLLYLHCWNGSLHRSEVLTTLDKLVQQGKVGMLGASNFNAQQLQAVLTLPSLRFIQNNHNLAVSDLSDELRLLCKTHNIHIVTYSPLGAGFLTGKHRQGVQAGSRFDIIPGHQQVYFNEHAQRRLQQLHAVAARTGYSAVHLALAWALHQHDITSVLIGGRTPAHLDQALAALEFEDAAVFAGLESFD